MPTWARPVLVILTIAGFAFGVRAAAWPLVEIALPERESAPDAAPPTPTTAPPDSVVNLLVRRDPLRLGRRPAAVAYDAVPLSQPPASAPPKPVLVVVGIVAGADPTAVIEGFPGVDASRVVRAGDVIAGLRVERIDARGVRIVGIDTTWVLTVREPWR